MLYPYTDNYIDDPANSREDKQRYNRLIRDKLKGLSVSPRGVHEKKTVELLEAVKESYIGAGEQDICQGLLLMLDAQQGSLRQQEPSFPDGDSEENILSISVYKGGLSVLIDRCLVDHPMTEKDISFYLGFGFVLQLADGLEKNEKKYRSMLDEFLR